ncbi:D-alanine--D-alanine ligase family protein [Herbivorax sp. ANBcel31]|uniref:D-alanine--D-alanine ligase family protein n=1 Tax=Herbivorax sp. ANBcel31 TaxID=3069754 RepID=UPI0027B01795|nr:D-alanine--D-alanine ligase family protein [Herbivorax sp. ANBcel31]MDQ2085369.1 D-alanine--D-alanine ligase family protein [Herbivorax sp. ANBcel31]
MADKIKVAVVFGGKTSEHIGSVESALYVLAYMDCSKYDIHAVYIKEDGKPSTPEEFIELIPKFLNNPEISIFDENEKMPRGFLEKLKTFSLFNSHSQINKSDFYDNILSHKYHIVFPVMHGKYGEDGSIQGLLEFLDVPYAGCGILGSAIGLDKEIAKRVCMTHGIPVVDFDVIRKSDWIKDKNNCIDRIEKKLSYPNFIKPSNLGSSIGVAMAKNRDQFILSVESGLELDNKLLIEKALNISEYGIGILEGDDIKISLPAKYNCCNEFLDYDAKFGSNALEDDIPAKLSTEGITRLKEMAGNICLALQLEGFSRIDIFIDDKENFYFNEVNTMPGFGAHSVFAKMWEVSGLNISELLDQMVKTALNRNRGGK